MEEEEDDLYGTGAPSGAHDEASGHDAEANGDDMKDDDGDEELEEGEEEEEDSESDIEIVTERADLAETTTSSRYQKPEQSRDASSTAPTSQQPTAPKQPTTIRITADTQPQAQATTKPILLPGDKYPAIRTSTIDLDHVPLWNGKPVTELDLDADLAEQMKPWRRPGADQSDYFNYGFDEFTWATYCMKQSQMKGVLDEQRQESKMFEQMMGGMGMPAMPGMPSYPGGPNAGGNSPMPGVPSGPAQQQGQQAGMPGMPNEQEMQQLFMQAMANQGVNDPGQVDFGAFMAQMQAGGGVMPGAGGPMGPGAQQGVPTGPGGGQQGWQGQQQGGYQQQQQGRGRGRRGGW